MMVVVQVFGQCRVDVFLIVFVNMVLQVLNNCGHGGSGLTVASPALLDKLLHGCSTLAHFGKFGSQPSMHHAIHVHDSTHAFKGFEQRTAFKQEYPKRVHIRRKSIGKGECNFGGHVPSRSSGARQAASLSMSWHFARQAKIKQLDSAVICSRKTHIGGLDIPKDYVMFVQILEGLRHGQGNVFHAIQKTIVGTLAPFAQVIESIFNGTIQAIQIQAIVALIVFHVQQVGCGAVHRYCFSVMMMP